MIICKNCQYFNWKMLIELNVTCDAKNTTSTLVKMLYRIKLRSCQNSYVKKI